MRTQGSMPPWCESRWKHFFAISYHDPTIERWQDLFVSDLTNICWAQVVVSCFPLFHTFFKTNSLFSHQNNAKEKKQPKGNFDQLMVKIYNTYFQQSKKPFYDLPSLMYLFLFIILSLASCFKWKKIHSHQSFSIPRILENLYYLRNKVSFVQWSKFKYCSHEV